MSLRLLLLSNCKMSRGGHSDCIRAANAQEDHDESERAAMVAVNLISSARVILKLDKEFTEYSAQFLVENASPKKESGQGSKLTVKQALDSSHIPRVSMKGQVAEAKELGEAFVLLMHQPVRAKLHVFSPEIDRVGEGIYRGPSSDETSYVGLRDVIICGVERIDGVNVASVKICYKKKISFINVSLVEMFLRASATADESQFIAPTGLLVDFIVPRLSK
ncbi:hypothetical protein EUTSA_v10011766mg [Eutrema salsugineum]|uniref:Uncharacterized protein n=1 Tax=Eutrema salsugineum TaxID=72664 RepID=V4MGT9_EUTSA|nr:hypothetical protein EUTSA_v10011766mg [Eutrema salsugineum]